MHMPRPVCIHTAGHRSPTPPSTGAYTGASASFSTVQVPFLFTKRTSGLRRRHRCQRARTSRVRVSHPLPPRDNVLTRVEMIARITSARVVSWRFSVRIRRSAVIGEGPAMRCNYGDERARRGMLYPVLRASVRLVCLTARACVRCPVQTHYVLAPRKTSRLMSITSWVNTLEAADGQRIRHTVL